MRKLYLVLALSLTFLMETRYEAALAQDFAYVAPPLAQRHEEDRIELKEVLASLEKKFHIYFTFESQVVRNKYIPAGVSMTDDLEETLTKVLAPFDLKFKKISSSYYTIYPKTESKEQKKESLINLGQVPMPFHYEAMLALPPMNPRVYPVAITISGTVTDEKNATLPGVNILEKGTTNGTTTDAAGHYTLNVQDEKSILVFSFIGYATQEIPVSGRSTIDIALMPTVQSLEEVVVVGYGTVERKDLTGSIGSIGGEALEQLKVTNVSEAMLGKIAGVQVKPYDGTPGKPPVINIRGTGSLSAGTEPLYVVDGFPVSDLGGINLSNVESIDVLKDASSTAIYGSRGSNGVVIITTKRGKSGATRFSFDAYYGLQKIARRPHYMNAAQQARAAYWGAYNTTKDAGQPTDIYPTDWYMPVPRLAMDYIEGKTTPTNPEIWGDKMPDTDWIDLVTRVAPVASYQLSTSGGGERLKFFISGEYMDQDGILLNSNFKRYSLQTNIDGQLSKRLTLRLSLNPSFTGQTGRAPDGTGYNTGSISNAHAIPAFIPPYAPDGSYFKISGYAESGNYLNGLALAKLVQDGENQGIFRGNIAADYKIGDNFLFNVMLGGNFVSSRRMLFVPKESSFHNTNPSGEEWTTFGLNWINQYTLNYNKTFGDHHITALGGFSAERSKRESNYMRSLAFPNNLIPYMSATDGIITEGNSDLNEWALISYLARLNYNYADKYYVTVSGRIDGSSRFGAQNRYGVFPSAALAWRISEEDFLQGQDFLSNLKLRVSYGQTGNNSIGNYAALATLNNVLYPLGDSPAAGFVEGRIPNSSLTWEKQSSLNAGIDAGVFSGRLNLTIDYFKTVNKDLLLNVSVPGITGFSNALQNIGEVENSGWEFGVNSVNVAGQRFKWSTDVNLTFSHNKVLGLGPGDAPIISVHHITKVGEPVGMFYGLVKDGIFETSEELAQGPLYNPGASNGTHVGDIKFKDFSGPDGVPDGIINSYDRVIMGSPHPDFFYGMSNTVSYQNFSLSVSLQGVVGNEIFSLTRVGNLRSSWQRKLLAEYNNFWISEEEPGDGETPRAHDEPTGGIREQSTYFLENGTYLRVNNITLGYTLPGTVAQKIGLTSARVYLNSTNPFLASTTSGYNPDVTRPGNPLQPGEDNNQYPLAKSLRLGLNLGF